MELNSVAQVPIKFNVAQETYAAKESIVLIHT